MAVHIVRKPMGHANPQHGFAFSSSGLLGIDITHTLQKVQSAIHLLTKPKARAVLVLPRQSLISFEMELLLSLGLPSGRWGEKAGWLLTS